MAKSVFPQGERPSCWSPPTIACSSPRPTHTCATTRWSCRRTAAHRSPTTNGAMRSPGCESFLTPTRDRRVGSACGDDGRQPRHRRAPSRSLRGVSPRAEILGLQERITVDTAPLCVSFGPDRQGDPENSWSGTRVAPRRARVSRCRRVAHRRSHRRGERQGQRRRSEAPAPTELSLCGDGSEGLVGTEARRRQARGVLRRFSDALSRKRRHRYHRDAGQGMHEARLSVYVRDRSLIRAPHRRRHEDGRDARYSTPRSTS